MRITKLTASNFMRLFAVDISPDGNVIQIAGKNRAGKSAVLNAIKAAFGGAKNCPGQPIRNGASEAVIVAETEEIRVTRKWTESGGETFFVESRDGARFPSPQKMLDKLWAGLSFDPLAFGRMAPREQAKLLRQVTGLDTTELDRRRKETYDKRTKVNHEVDQLKAQFAAHVLPADPGPVGEEKDLAAIACKKADAERDRAKIVQARNDLERLNHEGMSAIAEAERLEKALAAAKAKVEQLRETHGTLKQALALMVEPDTSAIDKEIAEAKAHNAAFRDRQREHERRQLALVARDQLERGLKRKEEEAGKLTAAIEWIDVDKRELLDKVVFPVPGMAIVEDEVTINGVPFSQASTSEQIRIGLEIGACLNPELRVALVHDGSLLDKESLTVLGRWAEERDMQVWLEMVEGHGVGVEIVDGHVAGSGAESAEAVSAGR